ncbi:MAG: Na+/H+ antiporter NhaA, partial [Proteobacteria bacterium]
KIVSVASAPVEKFLAVEASSGILLLIVAAVALIWVNSPWSESYEALWHTNLGLSLGNWSFQRDLHFWINDGLMTIFFFVVGLEIRREMHRGELSEIRRAVLPLVAAIGGMLMPAFIYFMFNQGRASAGGWGVPMATDIAFAVGVIALLGKRVSPALRILLLTLAVIDDIGAILVIAIFYSSELSALGFACAGLGLALIFVMKKMGIRSPWAYLPPAVLAWAGTYAAGIHPTIAGVIIGLMTPVEAWFGSDTFVEVVESKMNEIKESSARDESEIIPQLDSVETARKEAISPVDRLLHSFHGAVAYIIMPLFALANAGVPLGKASMDGDGSFVFWGVLVGLVIGKPLGILLISWLAVKCKIATLPTGVHWSGVTVVGLCAGIGFTMAFFVAQLAFPPGPSLETAKLAILSASVLAAFAAFVYGMIILKSGPIEGAALSESEAESATHM